MKKVLLLLTVLLCLNSCSMLLRPVNSMFGGLDDMLKNDRERNTKKRSRYKAYEEEVYHDRIEKLLKEIASRDMQSMKMEIRGAKIEFLNFKDVVSDFSYLHSDTTSVIEFKDKESEYGLPFRLFVREKDKCYYNSEKGYYELNDNGYFKKINERLYLKLESYAPAANELVEKIAKANNFEKGCN